MPPQYFLSVVIPAYKEKSRLRRSLPGLRDYLRNQDFSWEVIVVDDGSCDGTSEVPREVFSESGALKVLKNSRNRGKGYSVKQGVLAAQGELVLISDADFSTPIEEFEKLHACLKGDWDIAIGSRALMGSELEIRQAWYREGMGRIFNVFVQMMVLRGYADTQCGFKCFTREKVVPVFSQLTLDGFCFDVEFLFIAQKRRLKIKEVPVKWRDVLRSHVNVVSDPIRMFFDLMRIRFNNKKGLYQ